MTVRAVVLGILLGVFIACVGYANDWVLEQAFLADHLVPVGVYGLLILCVLGVNPLLRLMRRAPFRGSEWAVIVSLMLVACVVPGPGLMWTFSNALVMPHHYNTVQPGWKESNLLGYAPKIMLVDAGDYEEVVTGFMRGLEPGKIVAPDRVPWGAWSGPLSLWLPVIGLSFVAGICLILVVHRQWAHRERLRYPIADFASQLIHTTGNRVLPDIFHRRGFWVGFAVAATVMLVNGYAQLNTQSISIPMNVPLQALAQKWPALGRAPGSWGLLNPYFSFVLVGFAYLISSEISLSLGISQVVYTAGFLALAGVGVTMGGGYLDGGPYHWQIFGAYVGAGLILFYAGRRFYGAVLLRALGVPVGERFRPGPVWALRAAVLCAAAIVAVLVLVLHLHWLLAVLFVALAGLLFLVITRIHVETGLYFIQPAWHPVSVLLALFGINALGPNMLLILGILCLVLTIDPRCCLMPLVATALRFSEPEGVRPFRLGRWMIPTVLLALLAGVFVTLYVQYNFGATQWWPDTASRMPYEVLAANLPKFEGNPAAGHGLRLEHFQPQGRFLWAAGIGLALVLAFSALRLRHHWWPLHPILFMVWGSFPLIIMAPSFFLGWMIKTAVTRLGGAGAYRKGRTVLIGMIAGQFVAGIFWILFGLGYYMREGVPGPRVSAY